MLAVDRVALCWLLIVFVSAVDRGVSAVDRAVSAVDRTVLAVDRAVLAVDRAVFAVDRTVLAVDRAVSRTVSQTFLSCWLVSTRDDPWRLCVEIAY